MIENINPSTVQIKWLAAVLVVAALLSALGRLVAPRQAIAEAVLIHGWAIVVLAFTLADSALRIPFTDVAVVLAIAALGAVAVLARRRASPVPPALLRITALALPLLLLVAAIVPTQWDELAQWLPNTRYVVEHDAFPRGDPGGGRSAFPAYPYGLPFIIYLATRLAGAFAENAGALFNVILLLALGLLAVRVGRMAMAPDALRPEAVASPGFGMCALAICAATALNTTFVPKIAFTAYADTSTAVTLAFCAGFLWFALNALAERNDADARAYAWCTGFSATALVSLKQPNLVLFAAACIGALLVALRDRAIGLGRLVRLAPAALSLPIIAYGAWRLNVWAHIPDGEFAIRPVSGWFVDLIPRIVGQMVLVASKKGGYFALMLASIALAIASLDRMRGAGARLAVLSASIFLIYNAFLLFTYIAAFDEMNALRAGSYWRYNMHVGGVALLFAAFWTGRFWRRAAAPKPIAPIISAKILDALVENAKNNT